MATRWPVLKWLGTIAVAAAAAAPAAAQPRAHGTDRLIVRLAGWADAGGGGTIARGGAPEAALPLLALWAFAAILFRRRREPRTRRA